MLQTLIIDDEAHIRDTLTMLLARHCPNVIVVGNATNLKSGFDAINSTHPDLVFLDINLGDGNAFELLNALNKTDFGIVFISTFNKEAIQAMKLSGLEYLQKPFSPIELVKVINRSEKQDISNLPMRIITLEKKLRYSGRLG